MSPNPENTYERESTELVTVDVRKSKQPVTSNVFLSIVDSDLRPELNSWTPATITPDNKCGILLPDLPVGTYTLWVRVIDSPEDAVFRAGTVKII